MPRRGRYSPSRVITPADAVAAAARGLEGTEAGRRAAAGGRAGAPQLVRRLDAPGRDYYLVSWHDARGVVALIHVDGTGGEMVSRVVLPLAVTRLIPTPDDARRAVTSQLRQEPTGAPELVWCPCQETGSPMQPLYRVPVAAGSVFVAVSGSVHHELTPLGQDG